MSTSVLHEHRVVRHRLIDVLVVQGAFVFELRVVVHRAANPVPRRRLGCLSRERVLDMGNTAQVHIGCDGLAGEERMAVRIYEPRRDCQAPCIHSLGVGPGQVLDVGV